MANPNTNRRSRKKVGPIQRHPGKRKVSQGSVGNHCRSPKGRTGVFAAQVAGGVWEQKKSENKGVS